MKKINNFHLILVIMFFLVALFSPRLAKAEIATVWDWMGFFKGGTSGTACPTQCPPPTYTGTCDCKNATLNGNSWVYTSTCTQATPGPAAVPMLDRSGSPSPSPCTFTVSPPPTQGDYEFRMYANNTESSDALISSKRYDTGPSASSIPCPVQNTRPRAEGLISTPVISNNFGNPTGQCVVSNDAAFAAFKIPTYDSLKSLYFTRSKFNPATSNSTTLTVSPIVANDSITNYTNPSGLAIGTQVPTPPSPAVTYTGTGAAIVFVDGNLTINSNITNTTSSMGLVIIVGGNVMIDKSVTRIDAVIIAQGYIYTATDYTLGRNTCINSSITASQLAVNGSLISLNQDVSSAIVFCRTLADNSQAAELINQQAKYLVLLRDLYSDTLQKWSEITGETSIPNPIPTSSSFPTPTPTPMPTPSPTPSCDAGLATGLIGYWNFNEGTGNYANDSSGNGLNLTLGGGTAAYMPTWTIGKLGGGLSFDGINDYTTAANNSLFLPSTDMTFAGWIKLNQTASAKAEDIILFRKSHSASPWQSYQLYIAAADNKVNFQWITTGQVYYGATSTTALTTTGTWYYLVVVVKNATPMKIYLNGADNTSSGSTTSGTIFISNGSLTVGAADYNQKRLDGLMDDVRFYNRALTAAEVTTLYNSGNGCAP